MRKIFPLFVKKEGKKSKFLQVRKKEVRVTKTQIEGKEGRKVLSFSLCAPSHRV